MDMAAREGYPSGKMGAEMLKAKAKYSIGQIVRHRKFGFRGVVFDIDPVFSNTEEWWLSIPEEIRPRKDQPFYHLLAENGETYYTAYVSEQNLELDASGEPVDHPDIPSLFSYLRDGRYRMEVQMN